MGIDIGGTKTLVGVLDDQGVITEATKFPTPHGYAAFTSALANAANGFRSKDYAAACIAVPGRVNRESGLVERLGNLPWENAPLQADAEKILHCPVLLEHDGALGGLSEAMLLPKDKRVLYVTISTGIGIGVVDHQQIVPELANSEGGQMLLQFHGKRVKWESFASGHAIVERFGKRAADIEDSATWQRIAHDLAQGFIELIAIIQPDIIVVGGSVGRYFGRFKDYLVQEVKEYHNPLVPTPVFQEAARPDEAVLYGCYDFARQHYGPTT